MAAPRVLSVNWILLKQRMYGSLRMGNINADFKPAWSKATFYFPESMGARHGEVRILQRAVRRRLRCARRRVNWNTL
jgi:hypothetical protein